MAVGGNKQVNALLKPENMMNWVFITVYINIRVSVSYAEGNAKKHLLRVFVII